MVSSENALTKRNHEFVNTAVVKGARALGQSLTEALKNTDVVSVRLNERERKITAVKERYCFWCRAVLSLERFYYCKKDKQCICVGCYDLGRKCENNPSHVPVYV